MNLRHRLGRGNGSAQAQNSLLTVRTAESEPDRYQVIKKQLHRELKLHCVKSDVSVMDFVVTALQDKLARDARGRERRRARAS